jgi:hypothetical protein
MVRKCPVCGKTKGQHSYSDWMTHLNQYEVIKADRLKQLTQS